MTLPTSIPVNPAINRAELTDGRVRFYEIVDAINAARGRQLPDYRQTDHILPCPEEHDLRPVDIATPLSGVHVVGVPGFLTECVAFLSDYMTDGMAHLETLGARTSIAPIAGRGSCQENGQRLFAHLQETRGEDGERTIVVPMSKGAPDTLQMLATYPQSADRIDAIVSIVGCVCGSPLKDLAPAWLTWFERAVPLPTCTRYGGEAVVDLDPATRTAFLQNFHMPKGPRVYSIGAAVGEQGMSKGMLPAYRALVRYHPMSDGQMLTEDQFLPGATVLGILKCDHIAAGMPFNRSPNWFTRMITNQFLNHNAFPREVLMEAIVRQVLEDITA